MKLSKYNLCIEKDDHYFIFNQMWSSLLEIDKDLSQAVNMHDIASIPENIQHILFENGIMCEDNLCEANIILAKNKIMRFSNSLARVTILPTLDCNFHCWYCYETHKKVYMDERGVERILLFCKSLIENNCVKTFRLDWFGGEPLLQFNQIVYPLSKQIQQLCEENNVDFENSITTNGYLITPRMISKMQEILLKNFQITLDGSKKFHDLVRVSANGKGSFDRIVANITKLCVQIKDIAMTVRINYTPDNINSIHDIAKAFPQEIRSKIRISPHMVWQYKSSESFTNPQLEQELQVCIDEGYSTTGNRLACTQCYTENMKQYVINYNLQVFKCTARDFTRTQSIGFIDDQGVFIPNAHYYDYFISSGLEDPRCLDCHVLPSCLGICLQKRIEKQKFECNPQEIEEQVKLNVIQYIYQTHHGTK